jgi:hypothetical protein
MEPRGDGGSVLVFHVHQRKTLGENYKAAYEVWSERNPKTRTNVDAKLLLNQKNYILKAKRIPVVDIDDIQESIRHKIWNEDRTQGMNSNNRMVTINQKGEAEIKNTVSLGKSSETEAGDDTIRNKLKEELQIMWHKVRLLQMSERERLPNLKENSKLIKLKNEINVITEELLEENESDIKDINNLIYAAATIITEMVNQPSKRGKNRRNENFWKIRMQRQISNWRKEISILAEMGIGSDNSILNRKEENFSKI